MIDVQLGTGRAYSLTVHSGDNAHRLAAAFVAKYGLSEACVRPLAFRIQQVVSEFADTMEELEQEEKRKLVCSFCSVSHL